MKKKAFDVFICHASEDKDSFVQPLAVELRKRGLEVWYDDFLLNVGDSLRQKIEEGLAKSKYGVVIFSPAFDKKKWTKRELNGLFSREVNGNKNRILPIRHNFTVKDLVKRYPIQSDKYSLSSSAPLNEICDELIKVIKPELLKLDTLRNLTFDASESFIEAARRDYPGYDFGVSVGRASAGKAGMDKRVEIKIVDPSAMKLPPVLSVRFVGEGARKADEFIRTGKPQIWTEGDIAKFKANIPFFPEMSKGAQLTIGPMASPKAVPVRIECGTGRFELMFMKPIRGGTEEAEFQIASESEPLEISIIWPFVKKGRVDASCSWQIAGFRARQCLKIVQFLDSLRAGKPIKLFELSGDQKTIEIPVVKQPKKQDPFDPYFRRLVSLCAQIEEQFNAKIVMQNKVSKDESEALRILDSLINGSDIGAQVSGSMVICKGGNKDLDEHICQSTPIEIRWFAETQNFPGYFEVFGTKIKTRSWGLQTSCSIRISEADRVRYCSEQLGYEITVIVENDGRGKCIWTPPPPAANVTQTA